MLVARSMGRRARLVRVDLRGHGSDWVLRLVLVLTLLGAPFLLCGEDTFLRDYVSSELLLAELRRLQAPGNIDSHALRNTRAPATTSSILR